MKFLGVFAYWAVCVAIISALIGPKNWLNFFDATSLITVVAPSFMALFIFPSEHITARVGRCFKAAWFCAFLTFIYSFIRIFSHYQIETADIYVGLSVAVLPLLYSATIAVLCVPFLYIAPQSAVSKPDN